MNRARQQIVNIGRMLLDLKLQNTHSGNISLRQDRKIYMTRTGSMKGHLKPSDIIEFDISEFLADIPNLSSEAGSHRGILEYSKAVIHSHSIAATLMSYLSRQIVPKDWLGQHYLKTVPVLAFKKPAGSAEMEKEIPRILKQHQAMVVKTHGPFVKGISLEEALLHMSILDYSATILLQLKSLGVKVERLNIPDFPDVNEIKIAGRRKISPNPRLAQRFGELFSDMFGLRLSPAFTGSVSLKQDENMLVSFRSSIPRYINSVLYRIPIVEESGDFFTGLHKSVYIHSAARSAIFSHSPYGMIQSFYAVSKGQDYIDPDDAEGKLLYPSIPIMDPGEPFRDIVKQAFRHKMVVLTGFGVLSVGETPEQAIHHCSSLRNICKMKTWHEMVNKSG